MDGATGAPYRAPVFPAPFDAFEVHAVPYFMPGTWRPATVFFFSKKRPRFPNKKKPVQTRAKRIYSTSVLDTEKYEQISVASNRAALLLEVLLHHPLELLPDLQLHHLDPAVAGPPHQVLLPVELLGSVRIGVGTEVSPLVSPSLNRTRLCRYRVDDVRNTKQEYAPRTAGC